MKMRNITVALFLSACLQTASGKQSLADRIKNAKPKTSDLTIKPVEIDFKSDHPKTDLPKTKDMSTKPTPKTDSTKKAPTETAPQKDSPAEKKDAPRSDIPDVSKPIEKTPEPVEEKVKKEITRPETSLTEKEVWDNTKIQLNFESATLQSVLDDIADLFNLVFVPDEAVHKGDAKTSTPATPSYMPQTPSTAAKKLASLQDTKVTYRTYDPLTKNKTLAVLDIFLEVADLARIPILGMPDNYFRITDAATANKTYVKTFIGVEPDELPDTGVIRYMYFLKGANVNSILATVNQLKSKNSSTAVFQESNALIITDQAYNIKALMKIVKEIDEHGFPETLAVIRLKHAEASEAATIIKSLQGTSQNTTSSPYSPRPTSTKDGNVSYISSDTKTIVDSRANSLIVMGEKEDVKKIESFIAEHIDRSIGEAPDIFHVEDLNWVTAKQMATILNTIVKYGKDGSSGQGMGGSSQTNQSSEKFFSNMTFESESQGNRLIIRGSKEQYELIKPIIRDLDRRQPQVAVEVLIVNLSLGKGRRLESRMRTPVPENGDDASKLKNFNFQTSPGFGGAPIVINENSKSIVANLINLATAAVSGSTLLTLGKTSIWAIMSLLKEESNASIVANPFLIATNKYQSKVSLGETRRIVQGTITGNNSGQTEGDARADLSVSITPQINDVKNINLQITVNIEEFTSTNATSGNKTTKIVTTNANVSDGEVLALGGIIRDKITHQKTIVPILGKIPLIGNLFKGRADEVRKENLLIFMSPKIIFNDKEGDDYTQIKTDMLRGPLLAQAESISDDPVQRYFFGNDLKSPVEDIDRIVKPKAPHELDSIKRGLGGSGENK